MSKESEVVDHDEAPDRPQDWLTILAVAVMVAATIACIVIVSQS